MPNQRRVSASSSPRAEAPSSSNTRAYPFTRWRSTRSPLIVLVALAFLIVDLGLGAGSPSAANPINPADPSPASATNEDPDPTPQATSTADVPSADEVRAEVAPGEPVEVAVALREADGSLVIESRAAIGPDEAVEVISEAATEPTVVAADVPKPVEALAGDPYRTLPFVYDSQALTGQYGLTMLCTDQVATTIQGNTCDGAYSSAVATGRSTVIAVLDSPVQADHPDLAAKMLPGANCTIAPCASKNYLGSEVTGSHGTAVAGVAAAVTNNGIGIAGQAQDAQLLPVAVLENSGSGNTASVARGILWAIDRGATVLNLSLGTTVPDTVMQAAVDQALAAGVVVVAAAGNSKLSGNLPMYPAAYPGVIGVGSITNTYTRAVTSNTGAYIDVVAPGSPAILTTTNTASTTPDPPYFLFEGTSAATPFVAGAVAQVKEKDPGLTPVQVTAVLTSTAKDLGPAGRDDDYGYGMVDPVKALGVPALTPIELRYAALGGASSVLGTPVGSVIKFSGGEYQRYTNGRIYWSAGTGAWEVYGAILAQYLAVGAERGGLGLPTSGERDGQVAGSRLNTFQGGRIYWSLSTGAWDVRGGILGRYLALGGERGVMGLPTSGERDGQVAGSRLNTFQGGRIYWSLSTGAWDVRGGILGRYLALGGERGVMGLPTSGERDGQVAGSRLNTFQGGRIYWSLSTGAWDVRGGILGRYLALGGERSPLGLPTSGEVSGQVAGSRLNTFQGGRVYWSLPTGAQEIYGGILGRYLALGGERSPLGLPTSGEISGQVAGSRLNTFEGGRVYWSLPTGAQEIYGGILGRYLALGGERGVLGLPTSGELAGRSPGSRLNIFQNGRIYWSLSTGAWDVYGAILGQYLSLGAESSRLGLPITGETSWPDGRSNAFQGGRIIWNSTTGAVTVRYDTMIMTGWLPHWTIDSSSADYVANSDLFSDISPFWLSTTPDSSRPSGVRPFLQVPAATQNVMMARLRAAGRPIIPTIADGTSRGHMAGVLADPDKRRAHVNELVYIAVANGYSGLDINYEVFGFIDGQSSWATTRPNWVAFINELSAALHSRGLKLAVSVPTSGYWVYDFAAMGRAADTVRVMTYDWSVSRPGPIGPIWWLRQETATMRTMIPREKLMMGVAAYGRDWHSRTISGTCTDSAATSTRAVIAQDTPTITGKPGAVVVRDTTADEIKVTYQQTFGSCRVERVAWLADERTVANRVRAALDGGAKGAAQWAIGYEDPAKQWPLLR